MTAVVGGRTPQEDPKDRRGADPAGEETMQFGRLLGHVPPDIRDVSFATSVRGYDRREVDAYVKRVNQVIAELEVGRSPQAAVKHALDRVGEQTSGVLQRAREVAEELTATALAEADHVTRRAKVESDEMVEKAQLEAHRLHGQSKEEADETLARARAQAAERLERCSEEVRALQEQAEERLRAVRAQIAAASDARSRLLEELRRSAAGLQELAEGMLAKGERNPEPPPAQDASTQTMPTEPVHRAEPEAAEDPAPQTKRDAPPAPPSEGRGGERLKPVTPGARAGRRDRPARTGAARGRH